MALTLLLLILPSIHGHGNMKWPPVWWDQGGRMGLRTGEALCNGFQGMYCVCLNYIKPENNNNLTECDHSYLLFIDFFLDSFKRDLSLLLRMVVHIKITTLINNSLTTKYKPSFVGS